MRCLIIPPKLLDERRDLFPFRLGFSFRNKRSLFEFRQALSPTITATALWSCWNRRLFKRMLPINNLIHRSPGELVRLRFRSHCKILVGGIWYGVIWCRIYGEVLRRRRSLRVLTPLKKLIVWELICGVCIAWNWSNWRMGHGCCSWSWPLAWWCLLWSHLRWSFATSSAENLQVPSCRVIQEDPRATLRCLAFCRYVFHASRRLNDWSGIQECVLELSRMYYESASPVSVDSES